MKNPLVTKLSKGSVRTILTISTLGMYFIAMFLQMFLERPIPETMNSIVLTVVAFYFGVRTAEARLQRSEDTSSAE